MVINKSIKELPKVINKGEKKRKVDEIDQEQQSSSIESTTKDIKLDPIEIIKDNEIKVLSGLENTNKIIDIISICNQNQESLEIIFQTIKSLEKIFRKRLDIDNKVLCEEFVKYRRGGKEQEQQKSKDALVIYSRWLLKIYDSYLSLLTDLMRHSDASIQLPTLTSLVHMMNLESSLLRSQSSTDDNVPDNLYYQLSGEFMRRFILTPMLANTNFNNHVVEHFKVRFLTVYQDVLYHTQVQLTNLIERTLKEGIAHLKGQKELTMERLVENIFDLLVLIEVIQETPEEWQFLVGQPMPHMVHDVKSMKKKNKKNATIVYPDTPVFKTAVNYWSQMTNRISYKSAFSKAWMTFLSLPLPSSIYKHVLLGLPDQVIPFLNEPTQLMDFFSKSYHLGGVSSILALNGLFILIHKYNLEYPEFFKKLYSLFQPGLIYAKYRTRFFKLAELFLGSTYLPNYIIAAFLKRCSYLCLISPAFGSMVLLPFIYNILKRHPECNILVNNVIVKKDNSQLIIGGLLLNNNQQQSNNNQKLIKNLYGKDSYLVDEEDPAKCQAIKSSLWEIQLLRDHYHPDVSKMAKLFDNGLSSSIASDDFINQSFKYLFETSLKKKVPKVPLAYQPVKQLISQNDDIFKFWKF